MISHPGANQHQFDHGKRAEAQGDAEAVLATADAHIVGEKEQEQDHPDLNDAHASLRSDDGLHPGRDLRRIGGNRNHTGYQQHDQARPLEQHAAQIAQGMEQSKNVQEDFVNHGKAKSHAEGVASPIEIEQCGIAVPGGRKYYGKSGQLSQNVAEEKLELAVQPAPEHDSGDSDLEDGMGDPERVIDNSHFFAHHWSLIFSRSSARRA